MCSIAGIVYKTSKTDNEIISLMTNIIKYRGPDDDSFLINNKVVLECLPFVFMIK
ncbi:MAG: hypothetical protein ACP5IC_01350 [Minisyncoccia bacterium]